MRKFISPNFQYIYSQKYWNSNTYIVRSIGLEQSEVLEIRDMIVLYSCKKPFFRIIEHVPLPRNKSIFGVPVIASIQICPLIKIGMALGITAATICCGCCYYVLPRCCSMCCFPPMQATHLTRITSGQMGKLYYFHNFILC